MKTALLALASLAGLSIWYAGPQIMGPVAWVRNELGISAGESAPTPSQKKYVTAQVEEGDIRRVVAATGTLNAIDSVEIGSQQSGRIAKVFVDFNDEVKTGQPLAQLDQETFKARVDEARCAVDLADVSINIAKAKLDRARIDSQESEAQLPVLKARLDKTRVSLDKAQADFQRKQVLVSRKTAAIQELEDATRDRTSAQISVREAEAIMAAHEHKVAGVRVDARRAELELESAVDSLAQKKALLQLAQTEFDRTTIRSPMDGVIVGRKVSKGQTVASMELWAQPLFTMVGGLGRMQINAKVDEADISMLGVGQQATFTVDGYPGREFAAAVRQIRKAPEVQDNVVTYTVVLSVANDESLLLPGMTALVRITVHQTGPVLKVPLAALRFSPKSDQSQVRQQSEVTGSKSAVVWVLGENGKPKSLSVGLGEEDGNDAAVENGELAKGDLVIIGEAVNSAPRSLFGISLGL